MTEGFHINGPAIVCLGVGASGALARCGVTVDGVRVAFEEIEEDVPTDASGPAPADVQHFGTVAILEYTLVAYDDAVLRAYLAIRSGQSSFPHGTLPPPGIMLGVTGNMPATAIHASGGDDPYVFPFTRVMPGRSHEVNLGTKRKGYKVTARAISGVGAGLTAQGTVLYHRTPFTLPS